MKKTIFSVLTLAASALSVQAALPSDPAIEAKVEKTLAKMTLDEKIGQMTELAIDLFGHYEGNKWVLDNDKVEGIIGKYKIGSILSAPGPIALPPQEWEKIIAKIQDVSMKTMGIPCIYGLDQNHGTTYTLGGILFPQNINLGAALNLSLAFQAAEVTAVSYTHLTLPTT